jgi:hypothetical protein
MPLSFKGSNKNSCSQLPNIPRDFNTARNVKSIIIKSKYTNSLYIIFQAFIDSGCRFLICTPSSENGEIILLSLEGC